MHSMLATTAGHPDPRSRHPFDMDHQTLITFIKACIITAFFIAVYAYLNYTDND